jgi:carboxyl-terminal processing protease
MNRRFQFVVVGFSTVVVALLLFGAVGRSASPDTPYAHLGVYSEVLSRIKADYVEEPDMKAVTVGAINGMLESIDPYASYLNADQYKQYLKAKDGAKRADIGLILAKRLGYMAVEDAIPGSPAAEAGFATGDVIESINNVSTRDMPLAFATLLLQGDAGTSVELGVIRVRRSEPSKMMVTRAMFPTPPVTGRLDGKTGVIAVPGLQAGRAKEVAAQITSLEKQGATRFVLDLRHSSTGSDEEGVALASLFMDSGLITYTQGQKQPRQDFRATTRALTQAPLVVIVNRSTAGGAEIAAAALMNAKRAQLVGERTYGDAAVRKTVALNDGAAVILSVAKYYSPDGKAIQDNGVTPNILQAEADAAAELSDDIPDAVQDDTAKKPSADELLHKAIESLPQ